MKIRKITAMIMALILMTAMTSVFAQGKENTVYPLKLQDFQIRDPFILSAEGKYYMYGTGAAPLGKGYGCYVSENLTDWAGPCQVFTPDENFEGTDNFWAPECHYYEGNYYLFATFKSSLTGYRGVGIFKSSSPLGPFELISDGAVTPHTRDCIDGTLYVENGQPWIVYVNEWTSEPDGIGTIAAARLSEDLSQMISEPQVLFSAKDALWAKDGVTDGPFLYKTSEDKLIMLWSNFGNNGYAVGVAYTSDNTVSGKWIQQNFTLYEKNNLAEGELDGGHAMLFTDNGGQLYMVLHSPNSSENSPTGTNAKIIPMTDNGFTVKRADMGSVNSLVYNIRLVFLDLKLKIAKLFGSFVKTC